MKRSQAKSKSRGVTIDKLAVMVQKGFDGMHEEMDRRFGGAEKVADLRYSTVVGELMRINDELRDWNTHKKYSVQTEVAQDREIADLSQRVTKLEQVRK